MNLEISPQDVAQMMKSGEDFLLLDCRTPEEYEQARIEGATLIPMQDLDVHMDRLQEYGDKPIVVQCRSGRRSLNVTLLLRERGFANVRSMAGGIQRWSQEIDPSVPLY